MGFVFLKSGGFSNGFWFWSGTGTGGRSGVVGVTSGVGSGSGIGSGIESGIGSESVILSHGSFGCAGGCSFLIKVEVFLERFLERWFGMGDFWLIRRVYKNWWWGGGVWGFHTLVGFMVLGFFEERWHKIWGFWLGISF